MKFFRTIINIIAAIFRPLEKLLMRATPSYVVRARIVIGSLMIYVGASIWTTTQTVVVDKEHYQALIDNLRRENTPIAQLRGIIYGESGEMIAASLPQYDVYLDFRDKDNLFFKTVYDSIAHKRRNIKVKLLPKDTIDYYFADNGPAARYLATLAPNKTAAQHARGVRAAYERGDRRYLLLRAVSYLDFKEMCKSAPYFSKNRNHIGLVPEERPHRQRPYGERRMAASTIGGVFAADTFETVDGVRINLKGHGRNGLERTFDHLLAGEPGIGYRQRIQGKFTTVVQREAVDGADVYTTIDMDMQTILDGELNKRILELGAAGGWAAVMETHTGQIKAISNLRRDGSRCVEDYNHFVMDRLDPGSTFKTVSYMVLLDDGKVTPDTYVDTGNTRDHPSTWNYHGKEIRDDHPVGRVTADEAIVQSSNISLAKLTSAAYEHNPERYLELIEKSRIFEDMHLDVEFDGAKAPRNRHVNDQTWSKVSLGQISYGYETMIPGMYMLNFYNAIANDGKLMRPYIVSRVVKDGKVLYSHEPEVINRSICSKSTLQALRHALEGVVEHGTAATTWNSDGIILREGAKSRKLQIAGKTGTAQRFHNGTYSGNGHFVSFAGYFPAEAPQYSCLVVIDARPGGNFGRPGGGYMAGPVFRNFAEQVYARHCYRTVGDIVPDSAAIASRGMYPHAKRGPMIATENVVGELGLTRHRDHLGIQMVDLGHVSAGHVPDVHGMGAADALYMLEQAGLHVIISGAGSVVSQSLPAGTVVSRGQSITITLR